MSKKVPKKRRSRLLALEPRILFDGALVDTAAVLPKALEAAQAAQAADAASHGDASAELHPDLAALAQLALAAATEAPPPADTAAAPVEWLVIDGRVPDAASLASQARPGMQVLVLDPAADGLSQIRQALAADGRPADALHIVSHGAPGFVRLGSTDLDAARLESRAADLAAIGAGLTASGDLLLYGCDVASTAAGERYVDRLGQLTGADVAASRDATGGAARNGNWLFEYSAGPVTATPFLSDADGRAYNAVLPTVNLAGNTGWTPLLYGSRQDPAGDMQAAAASTDIVGDQIHPTLFYAYDDGGTGSEADDGLMFRFRVSGPNSGGAFGAYGIIGIDADLNGDVDIFLIADDAKGATVGLYNPGSGLNQSPSTTSYTPAPGRIYTLDSSNYAFTAVGASSEPAASWDGTTDIDQGGKLDYFVSFRISFAELKAELARTNVTGNPAAGIAIDRFSPLRFILATATQDNSLNGDIGGVIGANKSALTWEQLGAYSPTVSASNSPPIITSGGGGQTASYTVAQDAAQVATITSRDPDGTDTLRYEITGGADAGKFTIDAVTGVLSFDPSFTPSVTAPTDADGDGRYEVTVGVRDYADAGATTAKGGLDTQDLLVSIVAEPDDTRPELDLRTGITPADGATGIAPNANLFMRFSEAVQPGTGTIYIRNAGTGAIVRQIDVNDRDQVRFSGNTVTVNPVFDLAAGTAYYVEIGATAFQDLAGNTFVALDSSGGAPLMSGGLPAGVNDTDPGATYKWNFTTGSNQLNDGTPPALVSSTLTRSDGSTASPADNATNVSVTSSLVLTFSEAVFPDAGYIEIRRSSDGALVARISSADTTQVSYSADGRTITIDPVSDLAQNTDYYVVVEGTALQDGSGNRYIGMEPLNQGVSSAYPLNFKTGVDSVAPTVSAVSAANLDGTWIQGDTIFVTVRFSEQVYVTGTPQLALQLANGVTRVVNYVGGSGDDTLIFSYGILPGESTPDLDYVGAGSLTLNGGSIKDASGNNANLALPAPGTANSLGGQKDLVVDMAPVNTIPALLSGEAGIPLTFSASVADSDSATVTVSFTATNGTLSLAGTAGLAFTLGDGAADTQMSFSGTLAAVNAAMAGMSFTGSATGLGSVRMVSKDGHVSINNVEVQDDDTMTVDVLAAVNPLLGNGGQVTAWTENAPGVAVNPILTVSDPDSATLASATVTIGNFAAGDVLSFTNVPATMGNIAAVYDDAGLLTLSSAGGTATLAQWQAALRAVSFSSTSEAPATTPRTISFSVSDGTNASDASASTVTVAQVNDAPVLADAARTVNVAEDAGAPVNGVTTGTAVGSLVAGISDADGAGALQGIALVASNEANGTWYFSLDGGATWAAVGAVSTAQSLLLPDTARLYFRPAANFNGTAAAALTIRAWDQTSGSAGSKVSTGTVGGTTAFSSQTDTVDAVVAAANDAPVASGAASLAAVLEDASPAGSSVMSLFAAAYSDAADAVAGGTSAAPLAGIAITGNAATAAQGDWQWSSDGVTWNTIATAGLADTSALVLDASTLIRFRPTADWNGTPGALTVRLSDGTGFAAAGSTQDLGGTGGASGWSAATVSLSSAVTAVNDSPLASGSATLAAVPENTAAPAGATVAALFGGNFSDAADNVAGGSSAHTLAGVVVIGYTRDSAKGEWEYHDGSTWVTITSAAPGSALALASTASLRFRPAADYVGAAPALTVALVESSVTVTTGATLDASSRGSGTAFSVGTVTLDTSISAVNDAPVASGNASTGAVAEDSTPAGATVSALFGASFSDVDGNSLAGIAVTANAASGTQGTWEWSTDGVAWNAIPTGGLADGSALVLDASTRLRFVPDADWNGTPGALTVRLSDGTGFVAGSNIDLGAVGGTSGWSAATVELASSVTALNDAPVASGTASLAADSQGAATYNTATVAQLFAGNFDDGADDVSGGSNAHALAGIAITGYTVDAARGSWQYSSNGGASWADLGSIAGANSAFTLKGSDLLRFVPISGSFKGAAPTLSTVLIDSSAGAVTTGQTIDASSRGGSTALSAATVALTHDVIGLNDGPGAGGIAVLADDVEDIPSGATMGTVGALFAGNFSGGSYALAGIAITGYDPDTAGRGEWQYWDGSAWTAIPVAGIGTASAFTLQASDSVRFIPVADWNGNAPPLTAVLVSDQYGAVTTGGTIDASTRGGTTGLSTNTVALVHAVTPVNDAPAVSSGAVPATLTVAEDSGTTPLGLSGLNYAPGAPADEVAQTLTYIVTTVPSAGLGTIVLADGVTVVSAGSSYSLAQIQGMQFKAAADATGSGTFSFSVQDDGGSADGGTDTLAGQSVVIDVTAANDAPVRTAGTLLPLTVGEDSATAATSLGLGGVSYGSGGGADEDGQARTITITSVPAHLTLWKADGVTPVTGGTVLTQAELQGLTYRTVTDASGTGTITWTVTDDGSPAATLTESLPVTVTALNDAPVRTGGTVADLTISEDAATTSLGLGAIAFGNGGGADEGGQTLTYRVTAVPSAALGVIVLADGTTVVTPDTAYTLAQIQGMQFRPAPNATGSGTFTFTVKDSGGTAGGGADTLVQSLTITVDPVNDAPVRTQGTVSALTVNEDSGTTSLNLGALAYGNGGGSDESVQALAYQVTAVPAGTLGQVVLADGSTVVTAGTAYSLAQLQGMQFKSAANASGSGTFSYTVTDNGSPAGVLAETLAITVNPVNDAPTRSSAAPSAVSVAEDSNNITAVTLGLAGLTYTSSGIADESAQTLSVTITSIPDFVTLWKADGTTQVSAGTVLSVAELQGLKYKTLANANGSGTIQWTVQDSGGTANNGVDSIGDSMAITVTSVSDAPVGTDNAVVWGKSSTYYFSSADFGYSDPNDSPADPFYSVRVTLPVAGTIDGTYEYWNGAAWTAFAANTTREFTVASLDALQGLRWTAGKPNNGGPTTFTFQVRETDATGQLDATPRTFTLSWSGKVPPVLAGPDTTTATYTEGGAAFTVDNALTLTNPTNMVSVTVTIKGYVAGDTLGYTLVGGIAASNANGVYTFTGTTSAANYETLLRSLTFRNTSDDPTAGGSSTWRAITVIAADATGDSGLLTARRINVVALNDAPAASGNATFSVTEDHLTSPGSSVSSLLSASFSDSTDGLSATPFAGIAITGNAATAGQGVWQYSTDRVNWTSIGTVGLSDTTAITLTTGAYLRFVPAANWNGTPGALTVRLSDGTTAVTNATGVNLNTGGIGGTGSWSGTTVSVGGSVAAVNDAPVASGSATLPASAEDTAPAGATVSSLFGANFSDATDAVAGGSSAHALAGVAIVGYMRDAAMGEWQYLSGGVWTNITGSVSESSPLWVASSDSLRFLPAADYNGAAPMLRVVLIDSSTSVTTGTTASVATRGTSTAFSASTVTLSHTVSAVADAPVLSDTPLQFTSAVEDGAAPVNGSASGSMAVSNFTGGVYDPEGGSKGIAVTGTGASGTWYYSVDAGSTWTAVGVVSGAQSLLLRDTDLLYFAPAANYNGTAAAQLSFRGWDQTSGSTGSKVSTAASGGATAFSSATDSIDVVVAPVNDRPTGANAALAPIAEDASSITGSTVAALFGAGYSDATETSAGGTGATAFAGIAVTGNAATAAQGTWEYSRDGGSTWAVVSASVSDSAAVVLSAADLLRFRPAANWNGTPGSLSVRLSDGTAFSTGDAVDLTAGSGGTGATGSWSSAVTLSTSVTPANDAPLASGNAVLAGVTEDNAGAGSTVSALFGGQYSDGIDSVSGGSSGTALAGIAIVGNAANAAQGAWQYHDGTSWVDIPTAGLSDANALVLGAGTLVRFNPAADWNGRPGTLTVRLSDGTGFAAGSGVDLGSVGGTGGWSAATVSLSTYVLPQNDAPTRSVATVSMPSSLEDLSAPISATVNGLFGPAFSDSTDQVSGSSDADTLAGIAITSYTQDAAKGLWEYSTDGGTSWNTLPAVTGAGASYFVLAATDQLRFVPAADYAGAATDLTALMIDSSGGAVVTRGSTVIATTGGGTAYSSDVTGTVTLSTSVTAVNDAPVRTAGTVAALTVDEDAPSTSLGLAGLSYGPGGGADEAGQTFTYTVTGLPSALLGQVTLSDGTPVTLNGSYSLAQLQAMRFVAAGNASGGGTFSFKVTDSGGSTNGGSDTVNESIAITVNPVNDAPVRTAGSVANLTVNEDAGATSLGLGGVTYGVGGGADEATQSLTYRVTTVPAGTLGDIVLADGSTVVSANTVYTLAEIRGMKFRAAADASGSGTFSYTVQDDGGTAGGGADLLTESLSITVDPVNDAPVRAAGSVDNLVVAEDAGTTSLGLGSLAYAAGGGAGEGGQALAITITSVPPAALGSIVLADGITAVTANTAYTLGELQGMQFKAAANANGSAAFSFKVQDDGGTANGGGDTLNESLTITVAAANDAPLSAGGTVTLGAIAEDSSAPVGASVSSLFGASFSDAADDQSALGGSAADGFAGVAIVAYARDAAKGEWQYSSNNGGSWTTLGASVAAGGALRLNATDLLRFVPAAGFNGSAPGLSVALIDGSAGAFGSGSTLDLSGIGATGGSTAYSSGTVALAHTVSAVNDAPVASGAASLADIAEDTAAAPGDTVGNLFGGNFADGADAVAGGSSASTLAGIAVVDYAADPAKGQWQYQSGGAGPWIELPAVDSADGAILLQAGDRLRFVPAADYNGSAPALTARLVESGGAAFASGDVADLSAPGATGGDTVYSSASVVLSHSVTAQDDAPTVVGSGLATLPADAEDTPAAAVTARPVSTLFGASFDDARDQVTGGSSAHALAGIAIVGYTPGPAGDWQYSADGSTWTTITGAVSAANALTLAATDQLRFVPAPDFNGAAPELTVKLIDSSATVTSGASLDTTGASPSVSAGTVQLAHAVTAVNDAPTWSGGTQSITVLEDAAAPAGAVGTLVASLVGGQSDVDAGAVQGLAITSLDTSKGSWYYTTDGGATWSLVGSAPSATSALLLAADAGTRLYFEPASNANGAVAGAIAFRAWDQSAGINGGRLDTSTSGGSSPFSGGALALVDLAITAVNDAPLGTDNVIWVDKNGEYAFDLADFGFADPDDAGAGHGFLAVQVTVVPAAGAGTLLRDTGSGWMAVTAGEFVSAADIGVGKLKFAAAAGETGLGLGFFKFRVQDSGGTANAGVDLDTTERAMLFNVGSQEAPTLSGGNNLVYAEQTPPVPQVVNPNISVYDVDNATLESGQVIMSLGFVSGEDVLAFTNDNATLYGNIVASWDEVNGILNLASAGSTATHAQWEAAFRAVTYVNQSDAPDTVERFISFIVNDGTQDSNVVTATITVDRENDAPTLSTTGGGLAYVENQAATAIDTTLQIADPDLPFVFGGGWLQVAFTSGGAAEDRLTVLDIGTGAGQIGVVGSTVTYEGSVIGSIDGTLDGVGGQALRIDLTAGASVAATQALARAIAYRNVSDSPSTVPRTVVYTLDDGGNTGTGGPQQGSSEAVTITLAPVNDAPAGADNAFSIKQGTQHVFGAAEFGFSDPLDGHGFAGVVIGSLPAGGTLERWDGSAWIAVVAGDFVDMTGNNLRFTAGGTPASSSFSFQVRDSGGTANAGIDTDPVGRTMSISVTAGDPPVLAGAGNTAYTEDDGAVDILPLVTVGDADSANLKQATITFTGGYANGQDLLAFTGTANISGSFNAGSGTLTLTGVASALEWQQVLRSVTYQNTSDAPSTATRTISVVLQDDEPTPNNSSTVNLSITVAARNDAPALADVPGLSLGSVLEDAGAPSGAVGTSVADLVAGQSDADGAGALEGIAITALGGTGVEGGTWYYTTNNGLSWTQVGSAPGDAAALLLAADGNTRLYYRPGGDFNGLVDPALTFRAWDRTSGSNGGTADTSGANSGGTTAFSSGTDSAAITVTSVADAPVGTSGTITLLVAEVRPLTAADFGFSDPGDSPADAFDAVLITSVPAGGTLAFDGVPVSATLGSPLVVSAADLATGKLVYTAGASAGSASFKFLVRDAGDTSNGGANTDSTERTLTLATYDSYPPVLTGGSTLAFTEGQGPQVVNGVVELSDDDSTDIDGAVIRIASGYVQGQDVLGFTAGNGINGSFNATTGELVLTGTASLADYEAALRSVTFHNGSDDPSNASRTIRFTVTDPDGNTSAALDSTVTITPVNDAPTLTVGGSGGTFTEGAGSSQGAAVSLFTGAAASTVESGQNLIGLTLTAAGLQDGSDEMLIVDGTQVSLGANGSGTTAVNGFTYTVTIGGGGTATLVLSKAAGVSPGVMSALVNGLKYQNTDIDSPTDGSRTFTITQLKDSGGVGNGGGDTAGVGVGATVWIAPVNDAPVAVGDSYTVDEGGTLTVPVATGVLDNDTDAEGDALSAILVSGPANGTLTLNADGSFSYTHDGSETSSDSFTYKVNDGTVDGNTVTVSLTVTPVNDAPTTTPVTLPAVAEDSAAVTITEAQLLANAGDVEGDTLTVSNLAASSGTLVDNGDGTWTFTPDANDDTSVSFSYDIGDGTTTVAGSASLDLTPVNDAFPTPPEQVREATTTPPPAPAPVPTTTAPAVTLPAASAFEPSSPPSTPTLASTPFILPSLTPLNDLGTAPGDYGSVTLQPVTPVHLAQLGTSPDILESLDQGFPALRDSAAAGSGGSNGGTATDGAMLAVLNGIPNLVATSGGLNYTVPRDAFVHTDGKAIVKLEARQIDGQPLPSWLAFDGISGLFNGRPSDAALHTLQVEVTARDDAGREARTTFTVLGEAGRWSPALDSSDRGFPALRLSLSQLGLGRPADGSDLLVRYQPISELRLELGRGLGFNIPTDAFAHTNPRAVVRLQALLRNGDPLPGWMSFDGITGRLGGTPPADFEGVLEIRVVARDNQGLEAVNEFTLTIGRPDAAAARDAADPAGADPRGGADPDEKDKAEKRQRTQAEHGDDVPEQQDAPARSGTGGQSVDGRDKIKVKPGAPSFADQLRHVREQGPGKDADALLARALAGKGGDQPAAKRV